MVPDSNRCWVFGVICQLWKSCLGPPFPGARVPHCCPRGCWNARRSGTRCIALRLQGVRDCSLALLRDTERLISKIVEWPKYHVMALALTCCLNCLLPSTHVAKAERCPSAFSSFLQTTTWKGEAPGVYQNHRDGGESSGCSSTGTWFVGRNNISEPWSNWPSRPGSKSQCKQELNAAVAGDLQLLLEHGQQLSKEDQAKGFSLNFPSVCVLSGHSASPQQSCRLAVWEQSQLGWHSLKMNSVK